MPYTDDTDRHCTVCHGTRMLTDVSPWDYSYSAKIRVACWSCAAPVAADEQPHIGPDALMDGALAKRGMTLAQWSEETFAEFHA